jgi:hypothetical protein
VHSRPAPQLVPRQDAEDHGSNWLITPALPDWMGVVLDAAGFNQRARVAIACKARLNFFVVKA